MRRIRAFTLIELLVVIAIIALLIAILLPSLESARRQAKLSTCLSRIKALGTSSRVYEADDPQGWGIPVHPLQYYQPSTSPTFVGAYEYGGKSGIGWKDWAGPLAIINSKYGTKVGFGPATRPMNDILYKGGFKDHNTPSFDRPGAEADTRLELESFRCPGDDGPPRAAHCPDWLETDNSSYDHFGTSYASNVFMNATVGGGEMRSNSPYLRPISRIPTPARTLYYEENIGRWAWSTRSEIPECLAIVGNGVDPGPTKTVRGWHGREWTFTRVFVDSHAENQRIYEEGTADQSGYATHYRNEELESYPNWPRCGDGGGWEADFNNYRCIIVRGQGWQKDTLPAELICTGLTWAFNGRPSYERCVVPAN